MTVSIVGLNRADVLAALYNASRPQGMGFLHYNPEPMQREKAEQLLSQCTSFDYLKGRVMKLSLKNTESFDEWGYDRDNGQGAAQRAIDALRANNPEAIVQQHKKNVEQSAALTLNRINEETRITPEQDGSTTVNLGLADVKDKLLPKIQEAKNTVK